jgi:hypothetical protein
MSPDLSVTPLPDLLAPAWFLLCWFGYTWFADREQSQGGLMRTMHAYRTLWARQLLQRDNGMVDTQIIANLMRTAGAVPARVPLAPAPGARGGPGRQRPASSSLTRTRGPRSLRLPVSLPGSTRQSALLAGD